MTTVFPSWLRMHVLATL